MNQRLNRLYVLFLAVVFTSFLGCSPTSTSEGTGEYFDDSFITTKVKTAILNEPRLKMADINVETFKGVDGADRELNNGLHPSQGRVRPSFTIDPI